MPLPTPRATSPGSVFSRGGLLQDGFVQLRLGQQPLEAGVLPLQLIEAPGLVQLQAAVLVAPAVLTLLRYVIQAIVRSGFMACGEWGHDGDCIHLFRRKA